MKNFIGALFATMDQSEQAYRALQEAGFDEEQILLLKHKRGGFDILRESVSIKSVGFNAIIGAAIGTGTTAFLGYLIGQGVLDIPAFVPVADPLFTLNALGLFLAQGAVTGAIVGVALRLVTAREKPAITHSGITHGGVILAVNVAQNQSENARQVMEAAGAIDLVNLTEKWNPNVWSEFREMQPPSAFS